MSSTTSNIDHERYRIEVSAKSAYVAEQSSPEKEKFVFTYTISVHNTGGVAAQLQSRHWIITDANGRVQEVHGDGVVGQQPRLAPGERFEYTSGALLDTPVGSMYGSYKMIAEDGIEFDAPIPAFRLSVPNLIH